MTGCLDKSRGGCSPTEFTLQAPLLTSASKLPGQTFN
jgi:hypothetical protein